MAPESLLFFKNKILTSITYIPLPLKRLLPVTNNPHGVRFHRHFFWFIFITLVAAFDTGDWALHLETLLPPRSHETHPPLVFLLPLWPFVPMSLLLFYSFYLPLNVRFFSLGPLLISLYPSFLEFLICPYGSKCYLYTDDSTMYISNI